MGIHADALAATEALKAHSGNVTKAAQSLGLPRSTFQSRLAIAKRGEPENPLSEIVAKLRDELEITKRSLTEAQRPRFTIRQDNIKRSEKIKGLIIGDAHNSPLLPDKSRFEWIGKHANKLKPDFIESIGDFESWDSLNSHDDNSTFLGRSKPTFAEDLGDMGLGLAALESKLNWKCDQHRDEGNHERRIYNFENVHPETNGTMVHQFHSMLEYYKWTHSPYGHINYRGGVGFVHCAINRLGKSYGGKNAEQTCLSGYHP